ncbi:MAG: hypothetical protein J1F09_04055 [Oscillospiraceae bacterium]|nr:hypothetical protein [Oscillospiraceae bacterium]
MKKLLSLILCGAMLLTLTACDSKGNSSDNSIVQPFDPVPVPEGGWTMEALAKTICFNGTPIQIPLTVESLGKEYQLKYDSKVAFINQKKDKVALIVFDKDTAETKDELKPISAIGVHNVSDELKYNNALSVNGIRLGSTRDEARRAFGEPPYDESGRIWAYFEDGKTEDDDFMTLWFDDNDKVSWISFRFR